MQCSHWWIAQTKGRYTRYNKIVKKTRAICNFKIFSIQRIECLPSCNRTEGYKNRIYERKYGSLRYVSIIQRWSQVGSNKLRVGPMLAPNIFFYKYFKVGQKRVWNLMYFLQNCIKALNKINTLKTTIHAKNNEILCWAYASNNICQWLYWATAQLLTAIGKIDEDP